MHVASIWNDKLRLRIRDEHSWQGAESLTGSRQHPRTNARRVLFHAASMGEFEQLLPIIRRYKALDPQAIIIASFFSSSGYSHGLRTSEIDVCTYLPFDNVASVNGYLDAIAPDAIIIDRYDVWRTFILQACARGIPAMLVNATLPSLAKGVLRPWVADTYKRLAHITAVTAEHAAGISLLTRRPVDLLSDTRVDRVLDKCAPTISNSASDTSASIDSNVSTDSSASKGSSPSTVSNNVFEQLRRKDLLTIVIGSCWSEELELTLVALEVPGIRLIIVPHEPSEKLLSAVSIPYTLLSEVLKGDTKIRDNSESKNHILVDSVGHLLSLYSIADAAFVGGGFGAGVHSVTEPAVYGMPIAVGPNINRSPDAQLLYASGLLRIINDAGNLRQWLENDVQPVNRRTLLASDTRSLMLSLSGSADVYASRISDMLNTR